MDPRMVLTHLPRARLIGVIGTRWNHVVGHVPGSGAMPARKMTIAFQATSSRPRGRALRQASAQKISQLLKARRKRDQFFGESLFSDPAWDILLEAYAAHLSGRRISVHSLCDAAAVPATTGLRWIRKLEEDQLLVREADCLDKRRTWMQLSATGAIGMKLYFESIDQIFVL